jgi:hypothetical protein
VKEPWRNHGSEILRRDFCGLLVAITIARLHSLLDNTCTSILAGTSRWHSLVSHSDDKSTEYMNKNHFSLPLTSSGRGAKFNKERHKNSHNREKGKWDFRQKHPQI